MMTVNDEPTDAWPFEALDRGGARAEVHVIAGVPTFVLGVDLDNWNSRELGRLPSCTVEVRTMVLDPLIVFLVSAGGFIYDLPFCPWINGEAWGNELLQSLESPVFPLLQVAFVRQGRVARLRRMRTAPATGLSLLAALRSCSYRPTRPVYNALVASYQNRWMPSDLLRMSELLYTV